MCAKKAGSKDINACELYFLTARVVIGPKLRRGGWALHCAGMLIVVSCTPYTSFVQCSYTLKHWMLGKAVSLMSSTTQEVWQCNCQTLKVVHKAQTTKLDLEATAETQPYSTKKETNTPKIVSLTNQQTDVNINQLFILDGRTFEMYQSKKKLEKEVCLPCFSRKSLH